MSLLDSGNPKERKSGIDALRQMGGEALPAVPGDVKLNGELLLLKGTLEVNKVVLSDTDRLARYRFGLSKEELEKLVNGEVLRKWHYSAGGKKLYVIELGLD